MDYDREASGYDDTRGGQERAAEAAAAVDRLIPARARRVVDVAGGTGIVSTLLAKLGHDVVVCDLSEGMLRAAQRRLPGRVVRGDAARLPFQDGSAAAVCMIWLLHLVDDVDGVLAEAVRVLGPGGRLLSTVDKAASHGHDTSGATDSSTVLEAKLADLGATPAGQTTFVGLGQGRQRAPDPVFTLRAFEKRS